jgi:hypothetical protein
MAFTDSEIAEAHEAVRRGGDCDNLYKLGLIYSTGQEINLVQAHMWFNLAAVRGSEAAKECRRELSDMMSNCCLPTPPTSCARLCRVSGSASSC